MPKGGIIRYGFEEEIARRVDRRIKELGFTYLHVAELIGHDSYKVLQQWLNFSVRIPAAAIPALCYALQTTPDYFFQGLTYDKENES